MSIITPGSPDFYINRKRYKESNSDVACGVEGLYVLRAIKPGRGVVRELLVPNLITNLGMNALGSSSFGIDYMQLGTGTGAPAFADTALGAFGVGLGNGYAQADSIASSSPYYVQRQRTWTSTVGGATGNWTEIGVSNQNTNGGIRTRALIVDGGGDPTTFTVRADEQFQGSYIFRIYAPLSDAAASITLSGTSYSTITRTARATTLNSANGWFPSLAKPFGASLDGNTGNTGAIVSDITSAPTGAVGGSFSRTDAAYTNDSFYQESAFRWGSASAVGTLASLTLHLNACCFQIGYSPSIVKLTTQELIHNQRTSWARR